MGQFGFIPAICRNVCPSVFDISKSVVVFAQYTGDSRYAMLHLDRVKEECWDSVSLNTSLWTREFAVPAPPIHIVDTLCSNDCSGHGHCSKGTDKFRKLRFT